MNHPIEVGKNFTCSGGSVDGTRHSFEPRQNCTQSLHVDRIPHIMCYKKCYDYKRRSRMIAVVNHIEIKPMKSLNDLKARFLCDKINVHSVCCTQIIFCPIVFED